MADENPATIATEPDEISRYLPGDYAGDEGWEKLARESDEVLGYDLAKEKVFDALEGVPFIVTRLTFRPGILRDGKQFNYISAEIVIGPKNVLEKRRIDLNTLPFDPGEHVVFNDSSTGIYRQLVQYLEAKQYITLPEGPADGKMGESRFDAPIKEWLETHVGDLRFTPQGEEVYVVDIRLFCKRGIRRSEYDNSYTETESVTRYLA